MGTTRDIRTGLLPSFGQAGTVGDNRPTLSICLRCRDGREDSSTDLDQRGGRRLAQGVADAFPDSTALHRGRRPAWRQLHEQLQATMHYRALGSRPIHLSLRRSRPDASCRRRPLRCCCLCRSRGWLSAQTLAAAGSARGRPRPDPAARLRGRPGRTAVPDTTTLKPGERLPVTYSHVYRRLAAAAIAGAVIAAATSHAEEVTIGQTFLDSGLDAAEGSNGLGARESRHRRATVPRIPRGRSGAESGSLGQAETTTAPGPWSLLPTGSSRTAHR